MSVLPTHSVVRLAYNLFVRTHINFLLCSLVCTYTTQTQTHSHKLQRNMKMEVGEITWLIKLLIWSVLIYKTKRTLKLTYLFVKILHPGHT